MSGYHCLPMAPSFLSFLFLFPKARNSLGNKAEPSPGDISTATGSASETMTLWRGRLLLLGLLRTYLCIEAG